MQLSIDHFQKAHWYLKYKARTRSTMLAYFIHDFYFKFFSQKNSLKTNEIDYTVLFIKEISGIQSLITWYMYVVVKILSQDQAFCENS